MSSKVKICMLRRLLSCIAVSVLTATTIALFAPIVAHADVVWSNEFLSTNSDKMIELGRNYFIVNSGAGSLTPMEAPGSKKVYETYEYSAYALENGTRIYLDKVFLHDNEYWGIYGGYGHSSPSGWYPMNELLVVYDRQDFFNENRSEFYDYTGSFSIADIREDLVTWQWPGSDYPKTAYNLSGTQNYFDDSIDIKSIKIYCAYKDEQGREWGFAEIEAEGCFIPAGAGMWDASERWIRTWVDWICLDAPSNLEDIPSFNPAPPPREWSIDIGADDWSPISGFIERPTPDVSELPPADPVDTTEHNNEFYLQNREDCVGLGRRFRVSGDNVTIREAPGEEGEETRLFNNSVFVLYYCLYDGEYWGFIHEVLNSKYQQAWIKMSDLLVMYDTVSFNEEYQSEFYRYEGDFSAINETGTVLSWLWPGSGRVAGRFIDITADDLDVLFAYKDEQNREWGFISDLYGQRNVWICLTQPDDPDIPEFHPRGEPAVWEPSTWDIPYSAAVSAETKTAFNAELVFVAVLVIVLVIGTIILIKTLWKPQGKDD